MKKIRVLLIDKRNLPVVTIDDECLNNLTYIDPDKGIFSMLNNVELFDTEELLLARVFEIMSHEFFDMDPEIEKWLRSSKSYEELLRRSCRAPQLHQYYKCMSYRLKELTKA